MEDKAFLYKITCQNQHCLFGWETDSPKRQVNRICPVCNSQELKVVKISDDND